LFLGIKVAFDFRGLLFWVNNRRTKRKEEIMPVLHRYKERHEHYVLTSIKEAIMTFQLTKEGEGKLRSAGVTAGQPFGRALLLDLYRSGDAYTHGSGPGKVVIKVDPRQMAFDFLNDPEPESLFPSCAVCTSPFDLHLVEIRNGHYFASILCPNCRKDNHYEIDSSIPLPLVTKGIFNRFLTIKGIEKMDSSVLSYKDLLNAEFQSKWDAIPKRARRKSIRQGKLFELKDNKQSNLI
jgi:hypothetical protein